MDPGWKEQRWDDEDMKERMIRCGVIVTEAEKGLDASLIQTMRRVKNSDAFFTCAHDEAEEKLNEAMTTFGLAYDQREGRHMPPGRDVGHVGLANIGGNVEVGV